MWNRASDADIWHGTISTSEVSEMVKFINRLTGNPMYVAEDRKDEYLAAGHKLAGGAVPEAKPKKTAAKKTPKK